MGAEPTAGESDCTQVGAPGPSEPDPSIVSGRRIGRHIVSRRVGLGGMGVVYEAFDPELERRVAIKVLRRSAMRRGGASVTTRMLREAQSLARLSHPNVVPVYDVGVDYGRMWVAMEFVVGQTMREWLEQRPTWREIVRAFVAAGHGLVAVHEAGLVHRDFKPSNVLIGSDGRVRVTDFGLARAQGPDGSCTSDVWTSGRSASPSHSSKSSAPAGFLDLSITKTGTTIGTPPYMAPEQHAGGHADASSDQFAYCVTLYEALWAKRPFAGETIAQLERAKTKGDLDPPPAGSAVPIRLWTIVRRGLSPNPTQRWPSMHALIEALEGTVGRRRRRVWPALAAVGIVAAGWWSMRTPEPAVCGDAAQMLARVWDERRSVALRQAIEAADVPYAPRTAMLVERRVDEHARRWTEAREQACGSASVHQPGVELARRMTCLDHRLHELDALLSVLETGDGAAVERAVQSVGQLRAVEECSEVDQAPAVAFGLAPIEDPLVRTIRLELHRVHALTRAGNLQEAAQRVEKALTQARALDDAVLLVETLVEAGQVRGMSSKVVEGEAALQEAALLAESVGYDELAAQAAIELAGLLAASRTRLDAAQWWARRAEAAVQRLGQPRMMQARLHEAQGLIALEEGDLGLAYEHFEAQLELVRSAEHGRQFAMARALDRLGTAALRAGRVGEARALNRDAYELMVEEVGEEHPAVGWVVLDSARLATRAGDLSEALERHARAREIFTASLGPDSTEVVYATDEEAVVLDMLGRHEEALRLHHATIERLEQRQGVQHPDLAVAYGNLGACLGGLKRTQEAVAAFERSLAINERAFGASHIATAFSHNALGMALFEIDRDEEARRHLQQALQIKERALGPDHHEVAYTIANLGLLDRKAGDHLAARGRFRHATGLLDNPDESDPVALAQMLVDLAELERETHEPAAARAAAERALRMFARLDAHEGYPARALDVIVLASLDQP
jgi:eukaryotic-like serine/threonine-protein kinase